MKKTVEVIDENTLEIKKVFIEDETDIGIEELASDKKEEELADVFLGALGCDPDNFVEAYTTYKTAEENFKKLYEPFKENLIKLHERQADLPNNLMVGEIKVTYVAPNTRTSIDTKKLKEEEPELAKKFTKTSQVSASIRLS